MKKQVQQLLDSALEDRPDLFLINMEVSEANQIRVIIDGDKGVKVQDCIEISRAIEHNLDRESEDFSLEVLSAGVSEPLTMARQYQKNIGRKLKVRSNDQTIEGKLEKADDNEIILTWKVREPKPIGKGKVTVEKQAQLAYDDIQEAKVMITF
ncbi:ribosome assembly cofactor RimP [Aureitalea marina]|uniref:Ribosome maturation factor RimP n=1 Tax=Aureitalea marina TaxID=930804 RepID=A0A2S7KRB2_9FLAO|nr:ribosome assembly cofactor RimP [Aureitalea marina]PQB05164.1 ribosome assembly cofactor RimP [Aureitalea marina]